MYTKKLPQKERSAVPKKGEHYLYIFSSMVSHRFEIRETVWYGGFSDMFRLAKGNVFTVKRDAEETLDFMNNRLNEVILEHMEPSYAPRENLLIDEEAAKKSTESALRSFSSSFNLKKPEAVEDISIRQDIVEKLKKTNVIK